MCEIFLKNLCLGCIGLYPQYNIDEIKYDCETYKEKIKNVDKCK